MKTKHLCLLFVLLLTISQLSSCNFSQMPFNGDITFHEISLTVAERFVRDSTQSTKDLWIFEHGNYSEYILLSRKDAPQDISSSLNGYVEYLHEQGATAELTEFLGKEAVFSSYTNNGQYCHEILFAHGHSFYAIALRGGDKADFDALINTVHLEKEATA